MTPASTEAWRRPYSLHPRGSDAEPFVFDPVSQRLFVDGSTVALPPRASAVLGYLLSRAGHVVSRDELIDEVWEGMAVADSSVTEAVTLVRAALGDERRDPAFIQTVPKRGYRFIAAVERTSTLPTRAPDRGGRSRVARPWSIFLVILGLAVLVASMWVMTRETGRASRPIRATLALPAPAMAADDEGPNLAISPDGRRLVYPGRTDGEQTLLHVVDLEEGASWSVEGSAGRPRAPFFAPDGESLAYLQEGLLMRVSLVSAGAGVPEKVATVPRAWGASGVWSDDGRIVLAPGLGHGLWAVEATTGAEAKPLTELEDRERAHLTPELLPDGAILFSIIPAQPRRGGAPQLAVVGPAGERRDLGGVSAGLGPRFVPPADVLFARSSTLYRAPLQLDPLVLGEPRPIETGVRGGDRRAAGFAGSREGTLAFLPAPSEAAATMYWVDLGGEAEPIDRTRGRPLGAYRISPDSRLLVGERQGDLWAFEFFGDAYRQLTAAPGEEVRPVWGPGIDRLTFAGSGDGADLDLWTIRVQEPGEHTELLRLPGDQVPEDWSPDAQRLLFRSMDPTTGADLWVLDRSGRRRSLVATEASERDGRFSPDGRWVAYVSDRGGSDEVWVRAADGGGGDFRITRGGAAAPRWGPQGREIFYRRGTDLYRVGVRLAPSLRIARPDRVLTERQPGFAYELLPEGGRVLIQRRGDSAWWQQLVLVQDWRGRQGLGQRR